MADKDQATGKKEPMPSSEGTSSQTDKTVVADKSVLTTDDFTLPENASTRTKEQFEKLKGRLAEKEKLLEKEEERKKAQAVSPSSANYGSSVLDLNPQAPQPAQPFMPTVYPQVPQNFYGYQAPLPQTPYLNPQQREGIRQGFIDENGNVDIQAFNNALIQANVQAQQAYRAAQAADARARQAITDLARFEESQQVKILHDRFPELDPINKETFDPNFFNLVKAQIHEDLIQGRPTRDPEYAARVAARVKESYISPKDKAELDKKKSQAVEEYKNAQEARNQGPFETGKGESRTTEDYKSLRRRTRAGDARALDERLNAFINKKE